MPRLFGDRKISRNIAAAPRVEKTPEILDERVSG